MLEDGRLLRLSKENFIELIKEPISKPFGFKDAKAEVENGAIWLDVREPQEFERGHLPDAINIPFTLLRFQVGRVEELDTDTHYIICCQDGRTSHAAAYFMTSQGFKVTVLEKGLQVLPTDELVHKGGAPSIVAATDTEIEASLKEMDFPEVATGQETPAGEPSSDDQAMVAKLKQYIKLLDKEHKGLEEKRVAEVNALTDALEKLRQENSQSVSELLELRQSSEKELAAANEEIKVLKSQLAEGKKNPSNPEADKALAEAKKEIEALKSQVAEGSKRRSSPETDEALKEQVKGYLEEIETLKEQIEGSGKGKSDNKALKDEISRMKKELIQAEMALDAEISSRQEMEKELEALKATIEH
jgi:rhodanese-related sulfurtransferase